MSKKIIILDGNKFDWTADEITYFNKLWKTYKEHTNNTIDVINQIAEDMNEYPDNILLLALDQINEE